jgi:hypothetical protein
VREIEDYNKMLINQGARDDQKIELKPQKFEALDWRKRELTDILTIPCSANIIQLELFKNPEE